MILSCSSVGRWEGRFDLEGSLSSLLRGAPGAPPHSREESEITIGTIGIRTSCQANLSLHNLFIQYQSTLQEIRLIYIQGIPKDTDTFQSIIIKKLDDLQKFFSYH